MKEYSFVVLLFALFTTGASAQLVNAGGTITIQPGAKLIVESDINNNSGTIVNNGTIEVEGDFDNSATVTSGSGSIVSFKGSTASDFNAGSSTFAIVENDKSSGDVNLTGDLTVTEAVDFSEGTSNIVLGANSLTLAPTASTNGTQATGYIVTNGTGTVNKEVTAAGTTTFDVGDATNFSPLTVVHSGTYAAGAELSAKVTDSAHPNLPAAADAYIARYWDLDIANVTNPSSTLTGTYVLGDVTGTETAIVGALYEGSEWTYGNAASGSTVVSTTDALSTDLSGTNFFGKADLTLYLQAAYNGTSMNKTLNDLGLIPLTSPYDNSTTATSIPAEAVDWIEIEVRDQTTGATVVSSTSAFLLTDGSIVGVDGTSLPLLKDALANTFVAVNHRNHLPIRTANTINLQSPVNVDLSSAANVYSDPAITTNDPQKDMGSGTMAMWMGDATASNQTSYNGAGSDKIGILIAVGFATPNQVLTGYFTQDVDMDGDVAYNGSGSDKLKVLITVGFANPNNVLQNHAQK